MPMWISWIDIDTQERLRIFQFPDPDSEDGRKCVQIARRGLAERYGIPEEDIPGFRVELTPWPDEPHYLRRALGDAARQMGFKLIS